MLQKPEQIQAAENNSFEQGMRSVGEGAKLLISKNS